MCTQEQFTCFYLYLATQVDINGYSLARSSKVLIRLLYLLY